ncbi:ankyrin [Sunxiuqinia dokdonensis]|uniref:Ankyrin n=2 Tax=Sunxiuqinia dokdonensis TaxID=1409788 RepID=A0A0L8V7U0_9BACT|nr:ankyrin [Sunxiuqinia dokdonensis]
MKKVSKNFNSKKMKTQKSNAVKMLISFSFVLLLLFNACGRSGDAPNKHAADEPKAASKVEKPKMDLQAAILSDNLEIVKQHLEAGTDINVQEQMSGSTPLITAVTFGKTAIAKALIDAHADLSIKNNEGATALHVAAFFCRIEMVQMLIDAKADKTVKNNFGATPRETVMTPFAEMKPIYGMIQQQLEPLGLKLDMNEVEKNRPVIAMMLQ